MVNWMQKHPLAVVGIVTSVLVILVLAVPVEQQTEISAPDCCYAFGDTRSVGQSFVPPPGLTKILIPIRSHDEATGPLILHVREEYFGPDIRTAIVFKPAGEVIEFSFEQLMGHPKRLIWVLEAPNSPDKSYAVFREPDQTKLPEETAYVKGRPQVGIFGFTLAQRLPRGFLVWSGVRESARSWEVVALGAGVVTAGFILFAGGHTWSVPVRLVVPLLVVTSILLHTWLAYATPVINDEGAYIQDAIQSGLDLLPFRDFLTKGPLYIFLLKAWQAIVPANIIAWRGLSALFWGIVIWLVAKLASALRLPMAGQLIAAGALAILPAVTAVTTPLLLQVVSTAFVLGALILVVRSVTSPRPYLVVLAGALMALAFLTRSSSAVFAVIGGAVLLFTAPYRVRLWGMYVISCAGLLAALFGISTLTIGLEKSAVLFNVEALVISQERAVAAISSSDEPLIREVILNAGILWRGAPWLMAGLLVAPLFLWQRLPRKVSMPATAIWLLLVVVGLRHWHDMGYLMPGSFAVATPLIFSIAIGLPLVHLVTSLTRPPDKTLAVQPASTLWLVVGGSLVLLWLLYSAWGRWQASYIIEFLPPLALLAGWVGSQIRQQRAIAVLLGGLLAASLVQGYAMARLYPHTGTMSISSLQQIAVKIEEYVPPGTVLFTAQPAVTAVSGHPIMYGYSHPSWYLYEQLGTVPQRLRSVYFVEPSEVTRYLSDETQFVVTERQTDQIYFDAYPERQEILRQKFTLIAEVPTDFSEHPFRLYARK